MQEQQIDKPAILIPMLLGAVFAGTISVRQVGDKFSFVCKNAGITTTLTGNVCIAELNDDDKELLDHVRQIQTERAKEESVQRSLQQSPSDRRASFKVVS